MAMVLVEQSGHVHRNAQARSKLQALWPARGSVPQFANTSIRTTQLVSLSIVDLLT